MCKIIIYHRIFLWDFDFTNSKYLNTSFRSSSVKPSALKAIFWAKLKFSSSCWTSFLSIILAFERSVFNGTLYKEDSFDKGQEIKESEINISGKYNENWDATSEIDKEIENLKSKGYLIVKQDDGISQGIFGTEDTNLNIYLKHDTEFVKGGKLINGKKDTKYNKEVTQTIEYKGVDNILNDTQSFTFADNVEYDLVTGEVVSVKDDDSEFKTDEVVSAKVQGYTVDKEKVESNTITRNDDNSTIIVTYKEKPKETVVKPDKPTESNKEVQDKTPDVKRKPDIKTGIQNIKKNPTSLIILTGLLLASIIGFFKVKKK